MNTNEKKLAQHFDGPLPEGAAPCAPEAQAYLADLRYLRDGARAVAETPQISDAQFSSFMSGIRKGIDAPAHGRRDGKTKPSTYTPGGVRSAGNDAGAGWRI